MKIAVTGATGFIGKHVLAELAKLPVDIITITRQPSYQPKHPQEQVVLLDLKDSSSDTFQRINEPDLLIHLAWDGLSNYQSLHHFERELPIHYRFLKGLVTSGLKSIFAAGTCFEYGMQSGPLNESMDSRPNNPYGFAKNTLRQQLEYLNSESEFTLTWGRLFYLYGEGQHKKSLLAGLNTSIKRGEQSFNMSGGEQLRDYQPVTLVAKQIVALALKQQNIGVINICSGNPISVRQLVDDFVLEKNSDIQLNTGYYPYPDHEPMAFWGDNQKLKKYLSHE
ncbi:MAG: nucleoside-diphosphate-sugar epimerase [Motiliproteus sp.]|jgi:nucleoside-diphosphate-sugar epimerase